jgi:hypothetical protein
MEELEKIVGNHGHSSSKKQKLIQSSEESSESSSGSFASASGSATEDLHDVKNEIIKEKKLLPGQKLDGGQPIPQSSDVPHTAIRGFLTNVIKDRKLKTVTAVIDINGTEFNFIANEKTEIQVGSNPGNINDLLPSETVVFTAKNHSILSHVRIIAGVAQGIINHVDNVANTMIVEETNKKKRHPLI